MVTAAAKDHGDLYTVIGVPPDSQADQASIAEFIAERGVGSITHLASAAPIWRNFEASSMPSWATVTAGGEVEVGGGAMPASVLAGDWADR